ERPGAGAAPEKYKAQLGYIAPAIGAQKLGYNITVLPPGKAAFPAHSHRVNEEMFFVLEGSGELRVGDQTWPVGQGDFIACPPGGPETAHQIFNNSKADLKYLAVSTMMSPEIAEYPDSGKTGVYHMRADADGNPAPWRYISREGDAVTPYWDGE
ncbi:MAG: cupin domain-containing protein, partial [Hyphomicrobiales bacterium]|nr:cupin domain-containing protein [Hyphomicrobiales bacterium]